MDLFFLHKLGEEVDSANKNADQAHDQISHSQSDVGLLRFDVERLLMITEALWSILKENHGYSDDELMKRVAAIDMRDGALDGRVATVESPICPQCKRSHLAKHRPFCLYCGAQISTDLFRR